MSPSPNTQKIIDMVNETAINAKKKKLYHIWTVETTRPPRQCYVWAKHVGEALGLACRRNSLLEAYVEQG